MRKQKYTLRSTHVSISKHMLTDVCYQLSPLLTKIYSKWLFNKCKAYKFQFKTHYNQVVSTSKKLNALCIIRVLEVNGNMSKPPASYFYPLLLIILQTLQTRSIIAIGHVNSDKYNLGIIFHRNMSLIMYCNVFTCSYHMLYYYKTGFE